MKSVSTVGAFDIRVNRSKYSHLFAITQIYLFIFDYDKAVEFPFALITKFEG